MKVTRRYEMAVIVTGALICALTAGQVPAQQKCGAGTGQAGQCPYGGGKVVRCPITGKVVQLEKPQGSYTKVGAGNKSAVVTPSAGYGTIAQAVAKKPKIQLREMDHTGKVSYRVSTGTDSKTAKQEEEERLENNYSSSLKRWETMEKAFTSVQANAGLKYDRQKPIKPFVEIVAKDDENKLDWAVYEIQIGEIVIRAVDFARSTASVDARAGAKYASMWNSWVKNGKKGAEPQEPKISKATDVMTLNDAQEELRKVGEGGARLASAMN